MLQYVTPKSHDETSLPLPLAFLGEICGAQPGFAYIADCLD